MSAPGGRPSFREILAADPGLRNELATSDFGRSFVAAIERGATLETAPAAPPELPPTDAAIRAAIAHTFVLDEIDAGPADRQPILAHSAAVMIEGRRRLRLNDDARGHLIDEAFPTDRFRALLEAQRAADARDSAAIAVDDVRLPSAWVRRFLAGAFESIEDARPRDIRAAAAARESLRFVTVLPHAIPDIETCRRHLDRAEFLEPLRILVGTPEDATTATRKDRFVGREKELTILRSFVDELASQGYAEATGRGLARVRRGAEGVIESTIGGQARAEGPLTIVGGGGLGKSTLIAKFALDHALGQTRSFPFVYLDFDSAALQAREPRQLLVEAARQIAVQYPNLAVELDALRRELRQDIVQPRPSPEDALFDRFRALVRQHATLGSRAFLLVLDTMEVVQRDPDALAGVVAFVERLMGTGFPELRIVAAGRAEIPELTRSSTRWREGRVVELAALSPADARELANRLGRDLLPAEWKESWTPRIVGGSSSQATHREPLAIRVAVEFLRAASPEAREGLSREIESMREKATSVDFVARLFERRVLQHVRDADAAKLAWPGLVIRRVTRDVAHRVLGPLCDIAPDRVDRAFDELAREVWMVAREGDALRHRPDLRARTMPLMRQQEPTRFAAIVAAATAYYQALASDSDASRAEWIYYRLLGGEPPDAVDSDWVDGLEAFLGDAVSDFDPKSDAWVYLKARTAARLLPRDTIRQLSTALAWDHIARTGASLRRFDDERIKPVLLDLVARSDGTAEAMARLRPDALASRQTVLIKTGCWTRVTVEPRPDLAGADDHLFAHLYLTARSRREDEGLPRYLELLASAGRSIAWDTRWPSLVQAMAGARRRRLDVVAQLDAMLADVEARAFADPGTASVAALRTAIVFGRLSTPQLARAWGLLASGDAGISKTSVALAELAALVTAGALDTKQLLEHTDPSVPWISAIALRKPTTAEPMRIAERPVVDAAAAAMRTLAERAATSQEACTQLRRVLAVRHDDWIVPMGYAATRAIAPAGVPAAVLERLEKQSPRRDQSFWTRLREQLPGGTRRAPDNDAILILQLADEAGDLVDTARLFLHHATDRDAQADLALLTDSLDAWRRTVLMVIEAGVGTDPA